MIAVATMATQMTGPVSVREVAVGNDWRVELRVGRDTSVYLTAAEASRLLEQIARVL